MLASTQDEILTKALAPEMYLRRRRGTEREKDSMAS